MVINGEKLKVGSVNTAVQRVGAAAATGKEFPTVSIAASTVTPGGAGSVVYAVVAQISEVLGEVKVFETTIYV